MERSKKPKVSIISVYYGGLNNLLGLIRSIRNNRSVFTYEIIVVNNKLDEYIGPSVKKAFAKVKFIKSPGNIGYGRGNNLGAKYAKGEYLLIINPDTILKPGSIDKLVAFLERQKQAAIVAPNLIYESGEYLENIGSSALTPIRGIFALSILNRIFPDNPYSKEYYLKDVPKNKLREADSVPGTAFLIRRSVYEKIGGFDKNFFLFFEETDLCRRVKEAGYKIYLTPDAVAVHDWKPAEGGEKLKKIYEKSRFYYFNKHFGLFSALIVEFFTRISKYYLIFFLVLICASLLRFWEIGNYINFGSDIGWYFLQARDLALGGPLPLVSIPTSVPVFRQGPIWTWILAPVLKLGNFDPISGAILTGLFGLLSITTLFFLIKEWYNPKTALISTIFASASYYLLLNDRMPFQTTPICLTTIIFAYFLTKAVDGQEKYYFWTGVILGSLFLLELAGFFLIFLVIIIFLINMKRIRIGSLWLSIAGFLLGILPFIIWDIKEGIFLQTFGFLGWFLIKIRDSISGIFFQKAADIDWGLGVNYIREFIYPYSARISVALFLTSLVFFIARWLKNTSEKRTRDQLILIWILLGLSAFFVRGAFSAAYFPFLFLPLIAVLSVFLEFLNRKTGTLLWIFLAVLTGGNIFYFVSSLRQDNNDTISYIDQKKISEYIVSQSRGEKFKLNYIGPSSQYESGDSSWRYLLWWYGNEPVISAPITYFIITDDYYEKSGLSKHLVRDFVKVKIAKE